MTVISQDGGIRGLGRLRLETRFAWDVVRARMRSSGDQPVILNSLPKSGTHLAIKLLDNMPWVEHVRFQLSALTAELFIPRPGEEVVDIGVASPRPASLARIGRRLARIPEGAFITAHVPHSEAFAALLRQFDFRMVLLIRDPRDVAVSSAAYLASGRGHALGDAFEEMDPPQRIMASIMGVDTGAVELRDLKTRVESVRAWQQESLSTTIRFEDLVGPLGGGDQALQREAVMSVARHIGVHLDTASARRLSDMLYGGTSTFRRGQIGGWRKTFDSSHREAVGRLLGDLLCELGYEEDEWWWRESHDDETADDTTGANTSGVSEQAMPPGEAS